MIVSFLDAFDDIGIIIAFIQTQMMQSIDNLLRSFHDDAIQRGQGHRSIRRSHKHRPFSARFTPIHWGRPRSSPPNGALVITPSRACGAIAHVLIIVVQLRLDKHALFHPM